MCILQIKCSSFPSFTLHLHYVWIWHLTTPQWPLTRLIFSNHFKSCIFTGQGFKPHIWVSPSSDGTLLKFLAQPTIDQWKSFGFWGECCTCPCALVCTDNKKTTHGQSSMTALKVKNTMTYSPESCACLLLINISVCLFYDSCAGTTDSSFVVVLHFCYNLACLHCALCPDVYCHALSPYNACVPI